MTAIDARLETIIEKIFDACFSEGQLKQAIGMALESERLDICQRAIVESKNNEELSVYIRQASLGLVSRIDFRNQVSHCIILSEFLCDIESLFLCSIILFVFLSRYSNYLLKLIKS